MEDADNAEFDEFPDDTESDYTADDTEYEEAAVDAEETEGVSVATRERSLVYTATQDTLFQKIPNDTRTHSLSLEWVFGMNPTLPAFSMQDQDQLVVLYAGAHVGVIYNHTSNSQHTLQGHRHCISCMCASDDRRWVATADQGTKNTVIIWDSYSGIPVNTLFNCHPKRGVTAMAFSGDSKLLVTLGAEEVQSVCIWDWTSQTEEPLWRIELDPKHGFQDCILFNPADSTQLLSRSKKHVLFYTRVVIQALGALQYFAMRLKTYSREAPERFKIPDTFMNPNMADMSLSQSVFHCRDPHVLTVTTAGNILVWDVTPFLAADQSLHKEIFKIISLQKVAITCVATTDSFIVTGDTQGNITFYDEDFRYLMRYIDFNLDPIVYMSFSKECTEGLLGGCNLKTEPLIIRNIVVSTIRSFVHVNILQGTAQILLRKDCEPLHTVACHPRKPIVAMANEMGDLKLWDYNDKVLFYSKVFEAEKNIKCLTFDPQGLYLAVGTDTGTVHILNCKPLQSDSLQSLQYTKDSIHLITFSDDSQYLATADAGKAVTVFCLRTDKSCWTLIGRYHSHYKPIKDLLFGVHLDSNQPRLLSLGMDRRLVEYDLENSAVNELLILSSERVEQSAVPTCMAWYPSSTAEQFLLVASDQYKIKLFNGTTKMCRKTVLGPTYGSPIKRVLVLPVSKDVETNFRCLAFIIEDKVGLQILPLDGNPFKSNALVCHPAGVSAFACSYDGRFVFTAGEHDCTVLAWETNLTALEAAAALGGEDMLPFYTLLEGGRDGRFYREMEDFFFYCQIRHQGINAMERRQISTEIPLTEVPSLMRALAFFPTEQEVEDINNEVKFSKYAETGNYVTKIDLEDFIKLYVNHRPAFGISSEEFTQAFRFLGDCDSEGQYVLQRDDLLDFLRDRGEHMTEEEVAECFTTLLGLNEDEDEEEEGEGKLSEAFKAESKDSEHTLECVIPEEISMETFTCDILGFPSSPSLPD